LRPIQARYKELAEDSRNIDELLAQGKMRAAAIATQTLQQAQVNMGFLPAHS
jgi:ribosomal protein L12E/L44/L45/RPP1/RPP2